MPSLNNPNHVFNTYGETDSDVEHIENFLKGKNEKNPKEYNYTDIDEEMAGKQADLRKQETTRYHHDISRKKVKMRKLWS